MSNSFLEFLDENTVLRSSAEQQTNDARADARTIIAATRGLMQGRKIDASGKPVTGSSASSNKQTNAFEPDSIDNTDQNNTSESGNESMILKNNPTEVIYVTKSDEGVFITLVNKQRATKRTIALDPRGATLLKRYI